jgi:hypothetical protein
MSCVKARLLHNCSCTIALLLNELQQVALLDTAGVSNDKHQHCGIHRYPLQAEAVEALTRAALAQQYSSKPSSNRTAASPKSTITNSYAAADSSANAGGNVAELGERIRRRPHSLRTAEEKEWLGLDIVHRPSSYSNISLAEADEMRYDGGYACKLSPADVARMAQLPRRVTLALPFLHTPAELRAHELLCRYSAGLRSDHYKVLDAEGGDLAAVRHSAAYDSPKPAAVAAADPSKFAAVAAVVQGTVAAPQQQQQQQQQQQLLCRRRAVEALSKPPADRSWSEAAWCAVDSLLRPDLCALRAQSDAPPTASTCSNANTAAAGAGAADVSDMYDDDATAAIVVTDTSAAETAVDVTAAPDELQTSIKTELLKRGLSAEALRAVLLAVERHSSSTTSSSNGINGMLTLLPQAAVSTTAGVSRVPIGPETFESALHAALARHWCTEQQTVLGKDAAANVASLDALAVSLATDASAVTVASVSSANSSDALQLGSSTVIAGAGGRSHPADILAITHGTANVDSSTTSSGAAKVSTAVTSTTTDASSVTEPPIVCATLADVATLNPREARRRGVLIDCCGLTTTTSGSTTKDVVVASVEAEPTLLDISGCELSAGGCCVHKFEVQGLVLQIVVTVIFQVSTYFNIIRLDRSPYQSAYALHALAY